MKYPLLWVLVGLVYVAIGLSWWLASPDLLTVGIGVIGYLSAYLVILWRNRGRRFS